MSSQAPTPAPTFFIHVDLDGLWTLPQAYGYPENYSDARGSTFTDDPVYTHGLPRLLDWFAAAGVRATFFVVGRDLEIAPKRAALEAALRAGHALANHSLSHRMDLELLPEAEQLAELTQTNEALRTLAGGTAPLGFRAPGYTAGPRLLAAAARAGLAYDGSALPTPWAPLLRLAAGRLRRRVMNELGLASVPLAGGGRQYGAEPADPSAAGLVRLPAGVSPGLRLPLQMSLGMLLGARRIARGLAGAAGRGEPVTWLLHGLDALAPEEFLPRLPPTLARLRLLNLALAEKQAAVDEVLTTLRGIPGARIPRTEDWLASRQPGEVPGGA